jgi:hypothetical protein
MATKTVASSTASTDEVDLEPLRALLSGSLALPGEPGYELATPWNVAVPVLPLVVVLPESAEDIAAAVRFAGTAGLRVAVTRTGHGAIPLDAAAGSDVLLVHTGRLDECTVHVDERWARVGAGVIWQQVIDGATPHGLAPLAGSAPGVGVVGFLTGGGLGPLVRTYGVSSDHVRAFDVVTGDGQIRRATPTEHPELFWGLRGGKSTLGIVTAVEIDLLPLASIYGGALYFDGADAPAVVHAWQRWTAGLPESANSSLAILQLPPLPQVPPPLAGRLTVAVRFAFAGDPDAGALTLEPMRQVATPLIDMVAPMPYTAIGAIHADPVDPTPTHEAATLLADFPAEAAEALLAVAGPGAGSRQTIVELRHLGGALGRAPQQSSAFCQRNARFSMLAIGVLAPPEADAVAADGVALVAALAPWSTGRALANFAPSSDPERVALSYDEETLRRLGALAEQYDPTGVLRIGQVVRGAGPVG